MVGAAGQPPMLGNAADPMRDCILLAACGATELLPQSPDLPADVFTACLTTPIKVHSASTHIVQPRDSLPGWLTDWPASCLPGCISGWLADCPHGHLYVQGTGAMPLFANRQARA